LAKRGVGDLRWTPKDGDARVVPIPKVTVDLLTRLQATADEGNPYVFLSAERVATIRAAMQAGTWVANSHVANNLRRRWLAIVKAAGIRHATIHDLRRSAITTCARVLPIKVTKELAGHASITTTDAYYLTVTNEDQDTARGVWSGLVLTDPE